MGSSSGEVIRCCVEHPDYQVPLIWTLKFPGAERWCPHCGWTTGSFFSDKSIEAPASEVLMRRHALYEAATAAFLGRDGGDEAGWTYHVKAEDLPAPEPDPNRPEVVCDGCGKRRPARVYRGRCGTTYEKPAHWYGCTHEGKQLVACSETCVRTVAKKTGASAGVMPW